MTEISIEKQIAYWRTGALESMDDAAYLVNGGRISLGLFAAHLSIEKAMKAHVVKITKKMPPKIHDLLRLAEIGQVTISLAQADFLSKMNLYQIEGRYADQAFQIPSLQKTKEHLKYAKEIMEWLISQL